MYHAADYSTVQAQYCQNGFTCFAEPTFRAAGGCCRLGDGANCQLPTSCVPQASLSQSCNAACSANARITKWSVSSPKYSLSNSGELIPSKHRFCLALLLHQLLANGRADTSQCRLHHCARPILVYLHDLHLIRTRLQRYCSFNAIRFSNTDIYEYRYFCYSYRNGERIGQQQRRRRRSRSRYLFD